MWFIDGTWQTFADWTVLGLNGAGNSRPAANEGAAGDRGRAAQGEADDLRGIDNSDLQHVDTIAGLEIGSASGQGGSHAHRDIRYHGIDARRMQRTGYGRESTDRPEPRMWRRRSRLERLVAARSMCRRSSCPGLDDFTRAIEASLLAAPRRAQGSHEIHRARGPRYSPGE
jgi:hypothetical protein